MDHLTQLLLAAQGGDRGALERFIAETQHDVWRLCRYLGDPDAADDLAQETFERAIGSLHRYRAEGPARHWVLTIARRTCVDSTRRRVRARRLNERITHQVATSPRGMPAPVDRVELDDAVARLADDRREAFVLTQVVGLRYDEAAELVGCPIGTIRSRVSRARNDLIELLADGDARHTGTAG